LAFKGYAASRTPQLHLASLTPADDDLRDMVESSSVESLFYRMQISAEGHAQHPSARESPLLYGALLS
jgi:hypothetical protein